MGLGLSHELLLWKKWDWDLRHSGIYFCFHFYMNFYCEKEWDWDLRKSRIDLGDHRDNGYGWAIENWDSRSVCITKKKEMPKICKKPSNQPNAQDKEVGDPETRFLHWFEENDLLTMENLNKMKIFNILMLMIINCRRWQSGRFHKEL